MQVKSTEEKYGNEVVCENGMANFCGTKLSNQVGPDHHHK